MNFLIFRDFSRIFRIYFRFKSIKNNLKKNKNGVYFHAGPTWMRRGTQGHMAEPREPTRALAWRGSDKCAYLYLLVILGL